MYVPMPFIANPGTMWLAITSPAKFVKIEMMITTIIKDAIAHLVMNLFSLPMIMIRLSNSANKPITTHVSTKVTATRASMQNISTW